MGSTNSGKSLSVSILQETEHPGARRQDVAQPKLSVIMPAFNEQDHIQDSIKRVMNVAQGLGLEYEVIIVDDGSKDLTRAVARNGTKDKRLKVVGYDKNKGKGYAIKHGFGHSIGDIVVFLDSDLDIDAGLLKQYVEILKDSDMVIASKRHPLSEVKVPFKRWFLSYAFHAIVKLLTGVKVTDTQSGLKAFRRTALQRMFKLVLVKKFAYDVELLCVASLLKLRIAEMPVKMTIGNGFSVRYIYRMVLDVLGIAYRLRVLMWYQRNLSASSPSYHPIIDPQ